MDPIETIKGALESRSKSWKHRGASIALLEVANDPHGHRRLEFEARSKSRRSQAFLQVYFWEDRWIWIDAREASKDGWKWEWTSEGRVAPHRWGRPLTKKIEDTFELTSYADNRVPEQLECEWGTFLAAGPRLHRAPLI